MAADCRREAATVREAVESAGARINARFDTWSGTGADSVRSAARQRIRAALQAGDTLNAAAAALERGADEIRERIGREEANAAKEARKRDAAERHREAVRRGDQLAARLGGPVEQGPQLLPTGRSFARLTLCSIIALAIGWSMTASGSWFR